MGERSLHRLSRHAHFQGPRIASLPFVSVDDTWIWESGLLIAETKRSSPGSTGGFRAIALLPIVERTGIDVVTGRMRGGQHAVDHVVSFEVRRGALVEVSQRDVRAAGMV